jgi:ipoprotein LpqH
MEIRRIAFVAAVFVAVVAACSSPEPALGGTTAKVTINGRDTGGVQPVTCRQTGWSWMIESLDKEKGFTAVVNAGDTVTAETVDFRDVGGFTGNYWRDNIGQAEVEGVGGDYTISGSADGAYADNPTNPVTATFRIEAHC